MVFARDDQAVGPVLWSVSICSLSCGSKYLLSLFNKLGYSVTYAAVSRLRKKIAQEQCNKPLIEKVSSALLMKVAWDNVDGKISSNVLRLVGKKLDFHGTLLISEQTPETKPLFPRSPWRTIDLENFPNAEDLVKRISSNTSPVRKFSIMFYGLVAMFRQNILSKDDSEMVSIDYLLRLSLQGHCTGKPAVISNLLLLDQVSNSTETARFFNGRNAKGNRQPEFYL